MTQPPLFTDTLTCPAPPPEVSWPVFIQALAEAHDKGMTESEKKAREKARREAKKRKDGDDAVQNCGH